MMLRRVIMATSSPIRLAMVRSAGLEVMVRPHGLDEAAERARFDAATPTPTLNEAQTLALRLACGKARTTDESADSSANSSADSSEGGDSEAIVVAADQLLLFDGAILAKAATMEEARARLWAMRGRGHALVSATVARIGTSIVWQREDITRVAMRHYSAEALDAVLAADPDILGSVACYRLEGPGLGLIARLDGDLHAAMGLPLLPLLEALRGLGALPR